MISVGERPQTYALDRAATGTGHVNISVTIIQSEPATKYFEGSQESV